MTRLVTGMRRMAVVVLQLSPKGAAEHCPPVIEMQTDVKSSRTALGFRSAAVDACS
jgi:hypothetical protein